LSHLRATSTLAEDAVQEAFAVAAEPVAERTGNPDPTRRVDSF